VSRRPAEPFLEKERVRSETDLERAASRRMPTETNGGWKLEIGGSRQRCETGNAAGYFQTKIAVIILLLIFRR
jgi:hypothetical protein